MYCGAEQQRDAGAVVELQGSGRTDDASSDFVELLARQRGADSYKYLGKYLPGEELICVYKVLGQYLPGKGRSDSRVSLAASV